MIFFFYMFLLCSFSSVFLPGSKGRRILLFYDIYWTIPDQIILNCFVETIATDSVSPRTMVFGLDMHIFPRLIEIYSDLFLCLNCKFKSMGPPSDRSQKQELLYLLVREAASSVAQGGFFVTIYSPPPARTEVESCTSLTGRPELLVHLPLHEFAS